MAGNTEPLASGGKATSVKCNQRDPLSVEEREMYEGEKEQNTPASKVSILDRVSNVTSLFLLAAVIVTSVASVAAGASCLASLSGLPFGRFPMFYLMGVVPTAVGTFFLVVCVCAATFSHFCGAGLCRYGMCCSGTSVPKKAVYVCMCCVFPVIVILVLLVLCFVGFGFYGLSQQLPPLDKSYVDVPGITGDVQIIRDENGLVHVKAKSRHDAYFGQGFAEAQDRLFQLEFYRLTGRGQLASVVGTDGIKVDKAMRVLNVKASAASLCQKADPKDLKFLQAFVDGINYYIQHESERPVEFFFMSSRPLHSHEPKPFTVGDICVIMRLLQFQMSSGMASEGKRFSLLFTPEKRSYVDVESLFNDFDKVTDTILTAAQLNMTEKSINSTKLLQEKSHMFERRLLGSILFFVQRQLSKLKPSKVNTPQALVEESLSRLVSERFLVKGEIDLFSTKYLHASNAWMARDGKNRVVGASDPHLGIEFPSVWYFTHLSFLDAEGKEYDAAGVGMVGLPGVHIGKTTYVSWGITMSMTDLEDLFVIANPSNIGQSLTNYTYRKKVQQLVPRRERILVSGEKDVVLDLEDTLFGPIVNEILGSNLLPPSVKLALYAVPLRHDDTESISALLSLSDPTVRTAYQLMVGLRKLRSPGFSIPISDRNGNIAYTVTGRHPKRTFGHTGKYPYLGLSLGKYSSSIRSNFDTFGKIVDEFFDGTYVSDDPNVTDSLIPPEQNPHFYSPADSTPFHISAANQKIYPDGYAHQLGFDYAWAYRGRRLHKLLQKLQKEDPNQLANITRHMEIQLDIQSNIWDQDFRDIVQAFNMTNETAPTKKWYDRLMKWDGRASIGSQEAAFFWRWLQSLSVLPLDAPQSLPGERYVWRMLKKPDKLMTTMCIRYANMTGLKEKTCVGLGLTMFRRLANTDFTERWGIDLNRLTGIHKMLHKKVIRPVFERTIDKDGDFSSLCVSGHSIDKDMGSSKASSMRLLYDMQNPDTMFFALPGGSSGNPYSEYYQNLLEKFGKGEYVRVVASTKGLDEMLSKGQARHRQGLAPKPPTANADPGTR